MNNVILINPGHNNKHVTHRHIHRDPPPVSLLYVATSLKTNGYNPIIIDTHITGWNAGIIEMIKKAKPIYIGITVIIGQFQKNAAEISRDLRGIAPIIWGGVMLTIMPDEIMGAYHIDDNVRKTGEIGAVEIANAYTNNKSIPNFKIHIPAWEILGDTINKEQIPYYHMIMSSRGCPFNCSFCYNQGRPGRWSRKWVMRTAKNVIDEMESLHKLCGTTVFTFGDDNFLVDKERAIAILEYCKTKGWYIEECIGHINNVNEELIRTMAGTVQTIIFSVETVTHRLQKMLNKIVDLDDVKYKVELLTSNGIACNISFMAGLPTEEQYDLYDNWAFMSRLKKISPWIRGNTYFYFPLPKTQLAKWIEKELGYCLKYDIRDYEEATFWAHSKEDMQGDCFRPWLSTEQYIKTSQWCLDFNEYFKMPGRPYVLDRVLKGDRIDLKNDLGRYI